MELVGLGAIVFALINFMKFVRAKDWNAAFTQAAVWVAGVIVVAVAAQAEIAKGLVVPGTTFALSGLDFASQILVGMQASSLFTFGNEVKKAIDNGDNAQTPPLTRAATRYIPPTTVRRNT